VKDTEFVAKDLAVIKILHIVGLAHGGVGQHLLSLLQGCDPRRFESAVAMAADESSMRPQFERHGVRIHSLSLDHYGGAKKNLVAFWQLAALLRSQRFDLIQTHTSVAGALGRVAAKMFSRAPVVHMIHAFAGHPRRSATFRRAAAFVERRLDRCTDFYIAGTRAMVDRGLTQRVFTEDKVELIYNGVDLARFDATGESTCSNRDPVCNGRSTVIVGFLGRLELQKGAEYLVRAAALVSMQNPRVRFLIAGEGSLRPGLEKLAAELQVNNTMQFLGWTQDTAGFLKQIDILAMPSLWEAFGLSAAEAMAAEKPVIASRVEGLPEVVEDGLTGVLVPPADPAALAREILNLAADPTLRRAMGRHGRARVERLFSLERMIARHEEFYERVASRDFTAEVSNVSDAPLSDLELSLAN
jgi:glycosyltransferase involved in cell wall biosynthesis